MNIDGRTIAAEILEATRSRVALLGCTPVVRAITCAPSAATLSYLRIKARRASDAGMELEVVQLPPDADEETIIAAIMEPGAHAIIVQLPLPEHLDTERVVNALPLSQDADVLSQAAYDAFLSEDDTALLPPVVAAVREILERTSVSPEGKSVAVVGQGKLVGLPVTAWLKNQGAVVTTLTQESGSLAALKEAAIIVTGAGVPGLITPDLISEGVVLIDAGTSESGGEVVGDADPSCSAKASVYTPVPGGVGPIAVACLFRNVVTLLERSLQGR